MKSELPTQPPTAVQVVPTSSTFTATTTTTTTTSKSKSTSAITTTAAAAATAAATTTTKTTISTSNKKRQHSSNEEQQQPPPQQQQQQQQQPITMDGERPMKRFYRQRAHCNPLAHNDTYEYPIHPSAMNWYDNTHLYPYPSPGMDSVTGCSIHPSIATTTTTTTTRRIIQPTVLDIGCGFGGLTLALASLLPKEYICGMEIRAKVTEYVRLRILAARLDQTYSINPHAMKSLYLTNTIPSSSLEHHHTSMVLPALVAVPSQQQQQQQQQQDGSQAHQAQEQSKHHYNNCAVLRTNSMKFLPNYFYPHTISKLFFCFPDPHFKRKNFSRRILSYRLLDEYAYILKENVDHKENGKLYAITDVKELHEWHVQACEAHPLFQPITIKEQVSIHHQQQQQKNKDDDNDDPCIYAMKYLTEEGQKVDRNGGIKYYIIYQYCGNNNNNNTSTHQHHLHAGNFFL